MELGTKVKRYKMIGSNKELAAKVVFPQFILEVNQSDIFGTHKVLLNQEELLTGFRLGNADSNIAFDQLSADLYKVDIEELNKDEYVPRWTKIEDSTVKDPIIDYILAKPKENQIKDIAHQLVQVVGNLYPIADQEVRSYIERIINQLNAEQLQDILIRKWSYSEKIKEKIRFHADNYAENKFNDFITIGKIETVPKWEFPDVIVPGVLGADISNSLYEREGEMNNFEIKVISDISSLPNIAFWHRNLGRGKGFHINGFKSNHYPDFIALSKTGKVIVIETKGGDRDNSDSAAKCRLGSKWAELAGKDFLYFMIFEKNEVPGSFKLDKAIELIRQL